MKKIIGPFAQIITLRGLSLKGSIKDEQLEILTQSAVLIEENFILGVGNFNQLIKENPNAEVQKIEGAQVLLPGFVDCHTHICFGGSREKDFAMRLNGKTYLEIAESGGGIWSTVLNTRKASIEELTISTKSNANRLLKAGITTAEVKSGYGLTQESELKMLQAIQLANNDTLIDLIPTFLGAHMKAKDFDGSNQEYLNFLLNEVLPIVKDKKLSNRVDVFTERSAFSVEQSKVYLNQAKKLGFDLTVHADQFTSGGSKLAVELEAMSADHLEASTERDVEFLAKSKTVAVALPGASIGLGEPFAPARKLLNNGARLAIASDWNPGSAPMGDLLTQASILATYEKLSTAEVLAGITFRSAEALNLKDRGKIETGKLADFVSFPVSDFRSILYHQGQIKPISVWKKGILM